MGRASALRYRLFGLAIDSELQLPELTAEPDQVAQSPPDLSIRIADSVRPEEDGGGYVLDIDGVARFTITDGRSILIAPAAGAGEREIRLFLLGSAMGAALHQRGVLPLHANAVAIDGGAVAFMGASGSGKSTLAAWFLDQGFQILADDVCVVRIDERRTALAYPGLPRLRLWQDALEATGRIADDHSPSFHRGSDQRQKFDVPVQPAAAVSEPLPLQAMFVLETGSQLTIDRVVGSRAYEAISANTYRGRLIAELGDSKAHVAACVTVARAVPVFSLTRPFDRAGFDAQCAAIVDYCRSELPSG